MEQTNKRGQGSAGGDAGNGDAASVMPPWQQMTMLSLRAERLMTAALEALKGGDEGTAAMMTAEAIAAVKESQKLAEKAGQQ